jgi:hypothetical protein
VPYELAFTKSFEVSCPDPEARGPRAFYINDCCWGGDVVTEQLLPLVKDYEKVIHCQEDWGWLIWFRKGDQRFEINIMCDAPRVGQYRIHLVAFRRKWLRKRIADTPELEALRDLVVPELRSWAGEVAVVKVDDNFLPVN